MLFNNAGYGLAGPLEGVSDEKLTRQMDTNLLGVIRTTQAFLPYFRERQSGLIITTTSIGGLMTFPFNSVYHATKWALEGWSESMAFELAPHNIRIKTVSPGGIKTDFAGRSLDLFDVFRDPARAVQASSAEQIPEVVYGAATDDLDQLRYVAGEDAKAMYAQRRAAGPEAARKAIGAAFLGE